MRMLMKASLPHETFNAAVRDGSAEKKMARILEETKPEAVYFTEIYGRRSAVLVVNVDEPSRVPFLAEPWFLLFNADVEFHVLMGPDDLRKSGLGDLGKKWV